MSVRVLKFGGTSVGSPEGLKAALGITRAAWGDGEALVVVSALAGVTDELVRACDLAVQRRLDRNAFLQAVERQHLAQLEAVASRPAPAARKAIGTRLARLEELLATARADGELSPAARDEVLATGERLSVPIFLAGLEQLGVPSLAVDACELIATDSTPSEAVVDGPGTRALVRAFGGPFGSGRQGGGGVGLDLGLGLRERLRAAVVVVPGFLAADHGGRTTLLGRGGSDYSATLLGAALAAERVEIWSDVDGVMSADPRLLPEAFALPRLSYSQAAQLARHGAKVLHPRAVEPVARERVPIEVRNTFRLAGRGTTIDERGLAAAELPPILALSVERTGGGLARIALLAGSLAPVELLRRTESTFRSARLALLASVLASPQVAVAVVRDRDLRLAAAHLHAQLVEEEAHAVA